MEKKDMASLIEVEDALADMDQVLVQFTGQGHANGEFVELDNVFNVIYRNSHPFYSESSEEKQELFFYILMNRNWTAEQRAEILMNGTIREMNSKEESFW